MPQGDFILVVHTDYFRKFIIHTIQTFYIEVMLLVRKYTLFFARETCTIILNI